jgi:hypothetical protein
VSNPCAFCKKKHSQVAFHYVNYVRECEASDIAECYNILTNFNLSDGSTKALDNNIFLAIMVLSLAGLLLGSRNIGR